jgi:hypothetical protein
MVIFPINPVAKKAWMDCGRERDRPILPLDRIVKDLYLTACTGFAKT